MTELGHGRATRPRSLWMRLMHWMRAMASGARPSRHRTGTMPLAKRFALAVSTSAVATIATGETPWKTTASGILKKSLWTGGADRYRELVDDECLMVLPAPPYVISGAQAIEAVANTPRRDKIEFDNAQIARPQERLIVLAYDARVERNGEAYHAYCTSTLRRLSH